MPHALGKYFDSKTREKMSLTVFVQDEVETLNMLCVKENKYSETFSNN